MSNFDPFFSSEYRRFQKDDQLIENQLFLEKKSGSQFISEIWSNEIHLPIKQVTQNTAMNVIEEKQSQNCKNQECSHQYSSSDNGQKKSSKNSPFHNFQKHLVITLRQILTMRVLSFKTGQQFCLANKIFTYFKKSQKTSRQFLQQVFGIVQQGDSYNNSNYEQKIRKGQLKQILDQYSLETIIQAQRILKHLTKIELDQCDLNQSLNSRKIQKKNEFIAYIDLFKTQLIQGKQRKKTYKQLAKKFNGNNIKMIEQIHQDIKTQPISDYDLEISHQTYQPTIKQN